MMDGTRKRWGLAGMVGLFWLMSATWSLAQERPSLAFKHLVFKDDFSRLKDGEEPSGWSVLKTMPLPQREIKNGAYRILTRGNTHCPACLDLKDFALEFDAWTDRNAPVAILYIDCRVQPDREFLYSGYRILYRWGKKDQLKNKLLKHPTMSKHAELIPRTAALQVLDLRLRDNREPVFNRRLADLGSPGDADPILGVADQGKMRDFESPDQPAHFRVEVEGNRVRLFHDGVFQGEVTDTRNLYDRGGMLGFDMEGSYPTFPGAIFIDNVQVFAKEPLREEPVAALKGIEVPWKYNRIQKPPLVFDVEIARHGQAYLLKGRVRGGPCVPSQPHLMLNPYARLETADGRRSTKLLLYRGTVGNDRLDTRVPPAPFGPADTSGAQAAECHFDYAPGAFRVAVGYDYYGVGQGAQLAGPCEVVVDSANTVLHEGVPMRGGMALTMSSPERKQVLERVPATNEFYVGFKEFLMDNHFFVEGEPVKFRADLLLAKPQPPENHTAEFVVRDAFKDRALQTLPHIALVADTSGLARTQAEAGLAHLTSGWTELKALAPGVYHLDIRVRNANGIERAKALKAFSILPSTIDKNQTPAEASGLPTLFGGADYPFQPAYQADCYHYASISFAQASRPAECEIHHALNKRVFLAGAKLGSPEALAKLQPYLPLLSGWKSPAYDEPWQRLLDELRIYTCPKPYVDEFKKSAAYQPVAEQALDPRPTSQMEESGCQQEAKRLKRHYWKAFTGYVAGRKQALARQEREMTAAVAPGLKTLSYAFPLPVNVDYMTPYGAMNSAGLDLKANGWKCDIGMLEAYWDECRYPAERNLACLAMMKMVRPEIVYYRDAEGYLSCLADSNNAHGWPPMGVMDVVPGFFKKAALLNVFMPVYFKRKQFCWAWDNGYRQGQFSPDRMDELLAAFNLANSIKPDKPARTIAYLYAQEWVGKHPEVLDPMLYPYNPADESIVFAYEEACRNSAPNGFFVEPDDLANLSPETVSTLVLPPLTHADGKTMARLRQLHAQGVSLVGFEDVGGLEDLFRVEKTDSPAEVAWVGVSADPAALALLGDEPQTRVAHTGQLNKLWYQAVGGQVLLESLDKEGKMVGPCLVMSKGKEASTLFWALEPTDIARSRCHVGVRMRGEADSPLLRRMMGAGARMASNTQVTSTEGGLSAFWGKDGKLYVMVYENAFPYPSRQLHPSVKVMIAGIGDYQLRTEKSYSMGARKKDELSFACDLLEEEFAIFTFEKP